MEAKFHSSYTKEQWLLVLLGAIVAWRAYWSRGYWWETIYSAIGIVVLGVAFIYLFNMLDGNEESVPIGTMLRVIVLMACVVAGLFGMLTFSIYIIAYFIPLWWEYTLELAVVLLIASIILVGVAGKPLWSMFRGYIFTFKRKREEYTLEKPPTIAAEMGPLKEQKQNDSNGTDAQMD